MKNEHRNTFHWLLALVLAVAAALRFFDLGVWSLSNDELSALNRLQFDSFCEMISLGARIDGHPAGVQAFLWWWTDWFGDSVWAVRLPFAIFGALSVYFTFLIGKRWFGSSTGLFIAAAMAFLQYPLLYSQLARPYSPGLLFPLIAIYFWTIIVFDQNRKTRHYLAFSLGTVLALYSHHFSFLLMLIVGLSGFVFFRRLDVRRYLLAALLVFLLYAPHLEIFFHQLGLGGVGGPEGWLAKPEPGWIIDYLHYAFNESWVMAGIFLLISLAGVFAFKTRFNNFHLLALSWFLALFFTGYFYSVYRNPVLQYSLMLFVFPFLLMLLLAPLSKLPFRRLRILLPLFLLAGTLHTVFVYGYYQKQHFGEFKGVANKIAYWNHILGKENVTNTVVVNGPFYIHYYLDDTMPGIRFAQYNNQGGEDFMQLVKITDSVKTPYFAHGWTKPQPKEVDMIIRDKFPCLLEHIEYGGLSAVSLYSKAVSDSCIAPPDPLFVFKNDFETVDLWNGNPAQWDTVFAHSGDYSYRIDEGVEYGPGITLANNQPEGLKLKGISEIEVSISAYSPDSLNKILVVISAENPETGPVKWRGRNIAYFTEPGSWGKVFFYYQLPGEISESDRIKIYIWNPERKIAYIDDFEIRVF
ncbi:MAG: glycosyltransferase family 39 protein [Bacteroidales bacterium]